MPHPGPPPVTSPEPGGAATHAVQGPVPEAVSAAGNPAPGPMATADPIAAAAGRRTLSTAFVMIGPDRHLTIGLRDGSTVVLRDVAMRATDYCGVRAQGRAAGDRYCGGYADVATARPGGAPIPATQEMAGSDATGVAADPAPPPR